MKEGGGIVKIKLYFLASIIIIIKIYPSVIITVMTLLLKRGGGGTVSTLVNQRNKHITFLSAPTAALR